MWAFVVVPVVWNFWFRRMANALEIIGGICHVIFLIATIGVLAGLGQRGSSAFVFNTLTHDVSGWTNPLVAWAIGTSVVAFPTVGEWERS